MISNTNVDKQPNRITLGKVAVTTGLCTIPVISVIGDNLYDAVKTCKLEKIPFKDSFIKTVEKSGVQYQNWFSSLKKFSSKKVGAIGVGLLTALDFFATYLIIDAGSKIRKKKLNNS